MNNRKRIRGILLFSLLTVASVFWLWCFIGAPSLTPEMAMHRKEAAELVGPSKVIAAEVVEFGGYEGFLLGETEHGYCLYEYDDRLTWWDNGTLSYFEKSDVVTIFSPWTVLTWYGDFPSNYICSPVFVIPESTRAVSASLTLTADHNETHYEVSQTVSLRQNAYFLFELDATQTNYNVRYFWHQRLNGSDSLVGFISGTATLELFDSRGEVIETIVMEFPATM